jgi:hypothetical protein
MHLQYRHDLDRD